MAKNREIASVSSRIPTAVGNLAVALSADLLHVEINGSGLTRS
ncbi:MAG: hypothetical protein R3281_11975 [Balneolaceae bacterium]|nr:hypothetical protein [Balneolaceae bacterium]